MIQQVKDIAGNKVDNLFDGLFYFIKSRNPDFSNKVLERNDIVKVC